MYKSHYFKDEEFEACSPSCKREQINDGSLARLDLARNEAGIPFVLSSAYRSPAWDISKGRSGKGAHTEGRAFDVLCRDSRSRFRIIRAALAVGFTRIGVASTFIHLDDSSNLTQEVIWTY